MIYQPTEEELKELDFYKATVYDRWFQRGSGIVWHGKGYGTYWSTSAWQMELNIETLEELKTIIKVFTNK